MTTTLLSRRIGGSVKRLLRNGSKSTAWRWTESAGRRRRDAGRRRVASIPLMLLGFGWATGGKPDTARRGDAEPGTKPVPWRGATVAGGAPANTYTMAGADISGEYYGRFCTADRRKMQL
jgi:hypothetical protein